MPYGPVIDAWAQWAPPATRRRGRRARARRAGVAACRCWRQSPLALAAPDVEDLLAVAMEAVTATRPEDAAAMRGSPTRGTPGELGPSAFFPTRGRGGGRSGAPPRDPDGGRRRSSPARGCGRRSSLGDSPARASLLAEGVWTLGVCPFCGAPPGFGDIVEDGRLASGLPPLRRRLDLLARAVPALRRRWPARPRPSRTRRAPTKGISSRDAHACQGYVKEVDRRERWNAGARSSRTGARPTSISSRAGRGTGARSPRCSRWRRPSRPFLGRV